MNRLINLSIKISIFLAFLGFANSLKAQDLPPINLDFSSYAVTSDGALLGYYGEKNRVDIKSTGDISKYVIWSLIATEDRDFYNHDGVSYKGLIRGIFKTLTGSTQGGSTLTMQLARNLFLTNKRTISRKVTEIELAMKLEKEFTKDEILKMYLNTVYFGHGAYGIWAASQAYFNKTPDKLSVLESAALVGMVQSPNGYDPDKYPGRMLKRRNEVLHNLVEVGKLSNSDFENLVQKPLGLDENTNIAPQFLEEVRKEAIELIKSRGLTLDKNQLKITTTLNYQMQKAAESAVKSQWDNFPKSMKDAQIGLVSIEPGTGKIRVEIGGNPDAAARGLNRAIQIKRQPGSSFKPFLYGSLLERGYTLAEPLEDKPIVVDSGTAYEWSPSNDDNSTSDVPLPMIDAIKHSVNLSAAYAISNLTNPDSVVAFAHQLGIESDIPAYPSIALGTGDVSPLEMASAFGVFASEGTYARPISILEIQDKDGNVLYKNPGIDSHKALDSATAFLVTTALKEVVNGGTASNIRKYYKGTAAGKTGTTQNFTDAWFVGYNPVLSTAIWIGFDNPSHKLGAGYQYGGTAAAPIWGNMMDQIAKNIKGFGALDFTRPSEIEDTLLCLSTGEPATTDCKNPKSYPINSKLLEETYKLHHPVEEERYDIHYGF